MFYGLNSLLKKVLPKRLFYRGLLIVAVPIVVLQITISIVFLIQAKTTITFQMNKVMCVEIHDVYVFCAHTGV